MTDLFTFVAVSTQRRDLAQRTKLEKYVEAREQWENSSPLQWDETTTNFVYGKPSEPPPKFPSVSVVDGLPAEFAEYFAGAVAWENPAITNLQSARRAWEKLLSLPPERRRFKSTWAAFMLGKSWAREDPERAIGYFGRVRELARGGFADSCGLAAASFGLEAQIHLRRQDYVGAPMRVVKSGA